MIRRRGDRGAGERPGADAARVRLRIDPAACDEIGMCAHVAPRLIGVDSWGYPVPARHPLGAREARAAAVAVSSGPRRALFLDDGGGTAGPPAPPRAAPARGDHGHVSL